MHVISYILLWIGGINWGLVGLGMFLDKDWNIVHLILGGVSWLESIVYILVGLAALVTLFTHKKDCNGCGKGKMKSTPSNDGGSMGGM